MKKKDQEDLKRLKEEDRREKEKSARNSAFEEQVALKTRHREASKQSYSLENEVTALTILFKFVTKKSGYPALTDEEWEKLKKPMAILHMNRVFAYCPFPQDGISYGNCNYYDTCDRDRCNADTCSNGYPSRGY
jgi:hypothetical protein